jgi:TatD DNase family protein
MEASPPFINFHTHACEFAQAGICMVNWGIREEKGLPATEMRVSVGLHPWLLQEDTWPQDLERLEKWVTHPSVWAIGETGFDRNAAASFAFQQTVFEAHLRLAEQLGKPLIIHCVRTIPELIAVKKASRSKIPWIVHGFNAKPALAHQLLNHGIRVSLGIALLREGSNAAILLPQLPEDMFFLETDGKDTTIEAVYERAAALLGKPPDALKERLFAQFKTIFHDRYQ